MGVSYVKCNNKYVKADVINKQVWDIIDTISKNLHVIEELSDVIKLTATEPEQKSIEDLEAKEKELSRNLEKQKGLYEVFSEDKINIDIYKDRAELLRNEEKRFRQDVKAIQLKILEKRNSVNLVKATQDFLLCLRSNPNTEKMDYLIKTFMRIIFKGIYIQNTEIVKVDINEPWKMCYDEALKSRHSEPKAKNLTEKQILRSAYGLPQDDGEDKGVKCQKKRRISTEESVYCCAPSDVK